MSKADFRIDSISPSDLPEVAAFLHEWHFRSEATRLEHGNAAFERSVIQQRLEWLLIENPVSDRHHRFGYVVRRDSGQVAGLDLAFPGAFKYGDRSIAALCSGSFFIYPEAQMLGFYMFRKYLNIKGYGFHFATTCNENSGRLWKALGAVPGPQSDAEYILPLNLGVMLPAFVPSFAPDSLVNRSAEVLGRGLSPLLKWRRKATARLKMELCTDWEKLASLARRHREAGIITSDRTVRFLEWRYGPHSPNHPADIVLFCDSLGNEGWISLSRLVRGRHGQIQGTAVLDFVLPARGVNFADLLRYLLGIGGYGRDALFFRPRRGLDWRELRPWVVRRRLGAPQVWVRSTGSDFDATQLDLVMADGDCGWSNRRLH